MMYDDTLRVLQTEKDNIERIVSMVEPKTFEFIDMHHDSIDEQDIRQYCPMISKIVVKDLKDQDSGNVAIVTLAEAINNHAEAIRELQKIISEKGLMNE